MSRQEVDARNLLCPMPVIRAQNAIAASNPGDELRVVCTDPGAMHDIPAWCRVHGHSITSMEQHDREIVIVIRVEKVP